MHFKLLLLTAFLTAITAIPAFCSLKSPADDELECQTRKKRQKFSLSILIDVINQEEQDFQNAVKKYAEEAKAGNADALYHLSLAHLEHFIDENRYIKVHALLTKAIRKKHVLAAYQLALLYEQGLGTERNKQMAILGYTIAASHGLDLAQYRLALIYLEKGNEMDNYAKALDLLNKAARQQNAEAKRVLEQLQAEIWDSLDLTL